MALSKLISAKPRARRLVSVMAAFGILLQSLIPMQAMAVAPASDASELLAGKVAICSPFGVTYVEVEPGEQAPAPVQPAHSGCIDCCPCTISVLLAAGGAYGCTFSSGTAISAITAKSAALQRLALARHAPRAPPAA